MSKENVKKKSKLLVIIILILIIIFVGVLCYIVWNLYEDRQQEKIMDAEVEKLQEIRPNGDKPELADNAEPVNYLADLQARNPDVVAWLTISGTEIDFPIVQCDDNSYYLDHGLDGETTVLGVPFLDYRCSKDFTDFNSIIYGHHIKNGRIFSNLDKFRDKDYFESHPTGTLTTEDTIYTINFIACFITPSDSFVYNAVFLSEKERKVFLKEITENATLCRDFDIDTLKDANIITLSTCAYTYEGARTVLIGYLGK
jgi:sortase B